jgi:hypothetical protein
MAGCSFGESDDVVLENLLPEDSTMAIVIDYSDPGQVKNFKEIKAKFPENGLMTKLIEGYDNEVKEDAYKYEKIQPIVEGEWKLLMGMKFPEGMTNFEEVDEKDLIVFVGGRFSEANMVEELLESALKDKDVKTESENGAKYWDVDETMFVARYGDIFFMTNTVLGRDEGLERLKNGAGLYTESFEDMVKGLAEERLAYIYVNGEGFSPVYEELYAEIPGFYDTYMKGLGDIFVSVTAEKDGLRMLSNSSFIDGVPDFIGGLDYEPYMAKLVPGEGVIVYTEMAGFGSYLDLISQAFDQQYNKALEVQNFSEGGDLREFVGEIDNDFMKVVVDVLGVEEEQARLFFDSPMAFALYDVGEYYPGMSLFMDVNGDQMVVADSLVKNIDSYLGVLISEFDASVGAQGIPAGLFKKEMDIVLGKELHKVYVDWSILPAEALKELEVVPGLDLVDMRAELYYGVTGDGIFTVALYPDFSLKYGKSSLKDNKVYQEALKSLDEGIGFNVVFYDFLPLAGLADRYVDLLMQIGIIAQSDNETYQMFKDSILAIKFIVSSDHFVDDSLLSEAFVKIP